MCGKRKPPAGGINCVHCLTYYAKYRAKLVAKGLCRKCGKRKPTVGWKQCEECLARQREYTRKLRDEVFAAYGGYHCNCPGCNVTEPMFLQIDHVNNDGAAHRKAIKANGAIYGWLKKHGFPAGFQVLCANCNYAKGFYGFCPHAPQATEGIKGVQRSGRRKARAVAA